MQEKPKPLSGEQVKLLKKTFRALDTDAVAKRFYTTLFIQHPQVKSLFPADLSDLSTKLISVFELVVYSFEKRSDGQFYLHPQVLRALKSLGNKHFEKGVDVAYYPIANEILIGSMRAESPLIFDTNAEASWRLALSHLSTAMLTKDAIEDPETTGGTLRDTFNYIKSRLFKS